MNGSSAMRRDPIDAYNDAKLLGRAVAGPARINKTFRER